MAKNHPRSKIVLITGGAKRIGKEICLSLSQKGYAIALHYNHSVGAAKEIAKTIRKKGGTCKIFPCDLSNEEETAALIANVLKEFSLLDVLINNASVFKPTPIKKFHSGSLDRHFAINFKAPYILTAQFAKKCKKGHIINILDTHITDNKRPQADYLLSKKTLAELTKLSAVELAPRIRVNGIAPGLILPPAGAKPHYLEKLAKKVPLKQKGTVKQIVQCVEFLIDNPYLTGQIIYNDGGEHLI
jgi:NAD(P)-dependent dehydrogenase (short-subunit alcohol dehydrogenase family)